MGRHSFYGLVRPALHGSGAGRDKRLFLIFPSFLYPGTFVPFQLKEKISINQYRHLTESLFFLKTYSLPKTAGVVFHLISTFGRCVDLKKKARENNDDDDEANRTRSVPKLIRSFII